MLTTPPAVRPNSALAPLATIWNSPDGFESDIDGCTLATDLLAEEPVVVIATIEADVVEDAALAVEVDFVAVGALRNADARSER